MQRACAVLYCHQWPVWLYDIFSHYLINGTIFGKMLVSIKCVVLFSVELLSETFFILRRIERDNTVTVHRSSCKVPVTLGRFEWKVTFSLQILEKCSDIKYHQNLPSGGRVIVYGRTT
jgi:hypothetical protein